MTDPKSIVDAAAADARDQRSHRLMLIAAAVAVAGIIALAVTWWLTTTRLQGEVADLQQSRAQATRDAQTLANQVRALGATPMVQPPTTVVPGPRGPTGATGRGIAGTQVTGGHLSITYTDGTIVDLGQVAGAPGPAGRSISATSTAGGHLIVTYSDGAVLDVGAVVGHDGAAGAQGTQGPTGSPGRGVASVTINTSSHLIVTYTDGTTSDAGPLPAGQTGPTGPQGPAGPQGPPPSSWTWKDDLGRTQSCTRSGGTDAQPTYTCTASPPNIKPGG